MNPWYLRVRPYVLLSLVLHCGRGWLEGQLKAGWVAAPARIVN